MRGSTGAVEYLIRWKGYPPSADSWVPDKDLAARLKAELQQKIADIAHNEFTTLVEAQSRIIIAEAQGGSWLQWNWRPSIMAIFGKS